MPGHRHTSAHQHAPHGGSDPGRVIRWPGSYDVLLAAVLAGRGPRLRRRLADLLELQPGQRVLDVGCGSGTLALALAERVGPAGSVTGIDAAPEMLAAARAKAARRGVPVQLQLATAQALPFPDASFDAAVTSLVLHHLPEAVRPAAVVELVRVVRPGGRVVLADYRPPTRPLARGLARGLAQHLLGHPMVHSDLGDVLDLAAGAGVEELRLDRTPVGWLGVVSGRTPPAVHR